MSMPNIWYTRIMLLKKHHGYTMKDLEQGIGVHESTINNWKIKEIKGANLIAVSQFFQVSANYIIGLTDNQAMSEHYPGLSVCHKELLSYVETLELSDSQYDQMLYVVERVLDHKSR